jgi:hypothetical protein
VVCGGEGKEEEEPQRTICICRHNPSAQDSMSTLIQHTKTPSADAILYNITAHWVAWLNSQFNLKLHYSFCLYRGTYNFCCYRAGVYTLFVGTFLAASTECSAGSNDHFVGGGVVPSLVKFNGWPLGGANFQY